jgi:hypothetical protein
MWSYVTFSTHEAPLKERYTVNMQKERRTKADVKRIPQVYEATGKLSI